jgi:signal transduction histidine kinase
MLGKTDAGEASLVEVNPFLTSLNDHLKRTAGMQQSLQLGLEVGVPAIRTDPRHLRENLLRLIADVRQAGEGGLPGSGIAGSGIPMVSTRTEISGEGKRCAQIVIRDTRKAAPGSQERAFDPYFQARPGKSNPGFSLALVYQFIAQCGGHIEVENTAEGSAYVMNFPAAEHAAAAKADLPDVQAEAGDKKFAKTKSTSAGQR